MYIYRIIILSLFSYLHIFIRNGNNDDKNDVTKIEPERYLNKYVFVKTRFK